MSFLNRIFPSSIVTRDLGEVIFKGNWVVIQELKRAKFIPQQPEKMGPNEIKQCEKCGRSLRRVVFTTLGSEKQLEVWQKYPLAVDGWICQSCGWAAFPRLISVEESVEYGRNGAEHASSGKLDEAEFWFRRIVASWPGYPAGLADLGHIMNLRADASSTLEEKIHYRIEAVTWFRYAVDSDPDCHIPKIRILFAQALALTGNEREALEVLGAISTNTMLADDVRNDADLAADEIRDGAALFMLGYELIQAHIFEPISMPLAPIDRKNLEKGRDLLQEAAKRRESFATLLFLGKVLLRLGDPVNALNPLQHANEIKPEDPDGCRELGLVYLELDRSSDALPIMRRALELRPDDAGLRGNLALVLLLTGNVSDARSEAVNALTKDPNDTTIRGLVKLIEDVDAGRRQCPRSLAEAEGRKG
jgi:tetratricopeptide (TPR) repeat protein